MEVEDHIAAIEDEGALLAAAARRSDPDAAVTRCPGWCLREVVKHTGHVHRWAAGHVARASAVPLHAGSEADWLAAGPGDDELVEWFCEGHAMLVDALRSADPGLQCSAFLDAPTPLAFWARRQAHETAIHRADAESAGGAPGPFDPQFAADGIDELVMGFAPTPRAQVRAGTRRVLGVEATDTGHSWSIGLGPEGIDAARGGGAHDCLVRGRASDLYLMVWNRIDPAPPAIEASGALDLLTLWSEGLQITW